MSRGMKVSWEVGERESIMQPGSKGVQVPRLGKNQGPVFKQKVVKVYSPKTN